MLLRFVIAPALLVVSVASHASGFNLTFNTVDCDGAEGFVSVPAENVYRIDTNPSGAGQTTGLSLPKARASGTNIQILNRSVTGSRAVKSAEPTVKALAGDCAAIYSPGSKMMKVTVRRSEHESLAFDVFYVRAAEGKRLQSEINRYMQARRTSIERGSSIIVESN